MLHSDFFIPACPSSKPLYPTIPLSWILPPKPHCQMLATAASSLDRDHEGRKPHGLAWLGMEVQSARMRDLLREGPVSYTHLTLPTKLEV